MKQKFKDLLQFGVIFLFAILIQTCVIGINEVQGVSMQPTLNTKNGSDRVIVEKISRFTKDYKRGQVIIFKPYEDERMFYIKRIIGLPGDVVEISKGKVYVNNNELEENYLSNNTITEPEMKVKVPKGEVFVLGDNRCNSEDSRNIGTISICNIKGHAIYRMNIWNLDGNKLK
ncbi:signal peptidase I [Haloimpatiens massiliensis]|uniref:signal peptidase I n=1 Tax=Haloimpatiens massiliensis TaxID=1658110 RepID=UPI0015E0FDB0|nr:signal peptidase I [Haloimpatiens massiliensis]